MAAISKHYGDVASWIFEVIDSCNTTKQIDSIRNLIDLYRKSYVKDLEMTETEQSVINLVRNMETEAENKYWAIYESNIC